MNSWRDEMESSVSPLLTQMEQAAKRLPETGAVKDPEQLQALSDSLNELRQILCPGEEEK